MTNNKHTKGTDGSIDMSNDEDTVHMSMGDFKSLLRAELKLQCLEGVVVDNWSGYDEAMREYQEALEDEGL